VGNGARGGAREPGTGLAVDVAIVGAGIAGASVAC
jgi:glycerol-3-phosphate dehydrogenase